MNEIEAKCNKAGHCPICGGTHIEFFDRGELNDDYTMTYRYECEDCGATGIECYALHFVGHYDVKVYFTDMKEGEEVNVMGQLPPEAQRKYRSNASGKEEFVKEVFAPLIRSFNSGWVNATYEKKENGEEFVTLYTEEGFARKICVTADSIVALIRDVFRNID